MSSFLSEDVAVAEDEELPELNAGNFIITTVRGPEIWGEKAPADQAVRRRSADWVREESSNGVVIYVVDSEDVELAAYVNPVSAEYY
jgi:hypothetical protein